MDEEDRLSIREYRVKRTQLIIDQQIETKFFLQSSSLTLLGLIALFITITIGVLDVESFCIKIILLIPFGITAIAVFKLFKNLKYKTSNTGVSIPTLEENIGETLSENLRIEFNANRTAIIDNDIELEKMKKSLKNSITLLMIAVGLSALLLIISKLLPSDDKIQIISASNKIEILIDNKNDTTMGKKKDAKSPAKNDGKFLDSNLPLKKKENEVVNEEELFDFPLDGTRATNNNKDKKKE